MNLIPKTWLRIEPAETAQGFVLVVEGTPEHAFYAAEAERLKAAGTQSETTGTGTGSTEQNADGQSDAEQAETPAAKPGRRPRR